ncbi:unnamed protein product [Closterium sp. NIES-64]|nr:unnamed protein product [Closterium sp. NIES-64]
MGQRHLGAMVRRAVQLHEQVSDAIERILKSDFYLAAGQLKPRLHDVPELSVSVKLLPGKSGKHGAGRKEQTPAHPRRHAEGKGSVSVDAIRLAEAAADDAAAGVGVVKSGERGSDKDARTNGEEPPPRAELAGRAQAEVDLRCAAGGGGGGCGGGGGGAAEEEDHEECEQLGYQHAYEKQAEVARKGGQADKGVPGERTVEARVLMSIRDALEMLDWHLEQLMEMELDERRQVAAAAAAAVMAERRAERAEEEQRGGFKGGDGRGGGGAGGGGGGGAEQTPTSRAPAAGAAGAGGAGNVAEQKRVVREVQLVTRVLWSQAKCHCGREWKVRGAALRTQTIYNTDVQNPLSSLPFPPPLPPSPPSPSRLPFPFPFPPLLPPSPPSPSSLPFPLLLPPLPPSPSPFSSLLFPPPLPSSPLPPSPSPFSPSPLPSPLLPFPPPLPPSPPSPSPLPPPSLFPQVVDEVLHFAAEVACTPFNPYPPSPPGPTYLPLISPAAVPSAISRVSARHHKQHQASALAHAAAHAHAAAQGHPLARPCPDVPARAHHRHRSPIRVKAALLPAPLPPPPAPPSSYQSSPPVSLARAPRSCASDRVRADGGGPVEGDPADGQRGKGGGEREGELRRGSAEERADGAAEGGVSCRRAEGDVVRGAEGKGLGGGFGGVMAGDEGIPRVVRVLEFAQQGGDSDGGGCASRLHPLRDSVPHALAAALHVPRALGSLVGTPLGVALRAVGWPVSGGWRVLRGMGGEWGGVGGVPPVVLRVGGVMSAGLGLWAVAQMRGRGKGRKGERGRVLMWGENGRRQQVGVAVVGSGSEKRGNANGNPKGSANGGVIRGQNNAGPAAGTGAVYGYNHNHSHEHSHAHVYDKYYQPYRHGLPDSPYMQHQAGGEEAWTNGAGWEADGGGRKKLGAGVNGGERGRGEGEEEEGEGEEEEGEVGGDLGKVHGVYLGSRGGEEWGDEKVKKKGYGGNRLESGDRSSSSTVGLQGGSSTFGSSSGGTRAGGESEGLSNVSVTQLHGYAHGRRPVVGDGNGVGDGEGMRIGQWAAGRERKEGALDLARGWLHKVGKVDV